MNRQEEERALLAEALAMNIDADGIPILNEIVEPDLPGVALHAKNRAPSSGIGLNLPLHEMTMQAVRTQLKSQLQQELSALIDQAASEVAASLEGQIRDTLQATLERRLAQLIDSSINHTL